jgi:long-chain acyl-CoA synthetase
MRTFPQWLMHHAGERPDAPALREKDFGIWQTTRWAQLQQTVAAMTQGLHAAGLRAGQHLLVVGENRPRLSAAMLAAQALGAVPVPLYQDAVASEFVWPLQLAEVSHAVVEDQEQLDKLMEVRAQCPLLSHLWVDDPRGLRHYREPGLELLDALLERGAALHAAQPAQFAQWVAQRRPEEVAALFFTSGTTGKPKGVVHTHASLGDRAGAGMRFDKLHAEDEVLAYLPPAWIGQNIFSFAQWLVVGYVVNCPESPATVAIDLKEVGPSYYFAPPRVFEGLLTSVTIRMEDASKPKRWLYKTCMDWARAIGPRRMAGETLDLGERLRYRLGDLLIYGPLRNALGLSRVRVAYTAGEAIGPDLFSFFRAIGVNLKQLYGSTETAVFVCLQPDHEVRADTVGVPIEGVEIQVAEGGEIWVRSPGLLSGYYKNPEATAEVLTADADLAADPMLAACQVARPGAAPEHGGADCGAALHPAPFSLLRQRKGGKRKAAPHCARPSPAARGSLRCSQAGPGQNSRRSLRSLCSNRLAESEGMRACGTRAGLLCSSAAQRGWETEQPNTGQLSARCLQSTARGSAVGCWLLPAVCAAEERRQGGRAPQAHIVI